MHRIKCPKCPKVFVKGSQKSAEQALRCHLMRKHSRAGQRSGRRRAKGANRRSVRRMQSVETLCFCPRCGLNIQKLAVALLVAER